MRVMIMSVFGATCLRVSRSFRGGVVPRKNLIVLSSSAWGRSAYDENDDINFNRGRQKLPPPSRRRPQRGQSREETRSRAPQDQYQRNKMFTSRLERKPQVWDRYFENDREFVYGIGPVLAALRQHRREIDALFIETAKVSSSMSKKDNRLAQIEKMALEAKIDIHEIEKGKLSQNLKEARHQGIALCASRLEPKKLDGPPNNPLPGDVWLILDQIQDPQNLGAIIRSARFLQATGVIISAKNSAPLSPACSKASAGAMEEMLIHATSNLPRFLRSASSNFRIIAAHYDSSSKSNSIPFHQLTDTGPNAPPTLLVLGSEGSGLRKLVKEACSFSIAVLPRPKSAHSLHGEEEQQQEGDTTDLDSLNVSVTAALLLNHLLCPPSSSFSSSS